MAINRRDLDDLELNDEEFFFGRIVSNFLTRKEYKSTREGICTGLACLLAVGLFAGMIYFGDYTNRRDRREQLEMQEKYGPKVESVLNVGTNIPDTFYEIGGEKAYTHIDGKPIKDYDFR